MGEPDGDGSASAVEGPEGREADRDPAGDADPLLAWTVATADVSLFVLLPVLAAHEGGALADLLGGLNTAVGLAVFAYLWALVGAAAWWLLSEVSLATDSIWRLALYAFVAGALVGSFFVLGVGSVAVAAFALAGEGGSFGAIVYVLLAAAVAVVVGGVVGLLAGAVNVGAYRLAGRLGPGDAGGGPTDAEATPDDGDVTTGDRRPRDRP